MQCEVTSFYMSSAFNSLKGGPKLQLPLSYARIKSSQEELVIRGRTLEIPLVSLPGKGNIR